MTKKRFKYLEIQHLLIPFTVSPFVFLAARLIYSKSSTAFFHSKHINRKQNIMAVIRQAETGFFILNFQLISTFILLTRRKATEALIRKVSIYPELLPEMPRYCCPDKIFYLVF